MRVTVGIEDGMVSFGTTAKDGMTRFTARVTFLRGLDVALALVRKLLAEMDDDHAGAFKRELGRLVEFDTVTRK